MAGVKPLCQSLSTKAAAHSHSIVRIGPNELICRCKKFLRLENSRRPNRQIRMAFEFKDEFDRSGNSPRSVTINIDRSTFPESTGDAAPPRWPKTTVGS